MTDKLPTIIKTYLIASVLYYLIILLVSPETVSKQFINSKPVNLIGASSILAKTTPNAYAIDLNKAISSEPKSFDLVFNINVNCISIGDKAN